MAFHVYVYICKESKIGQISKGKVDKSIGIGKVMRCVALAEAEMMTKSAVRVCRGELVSPIR